ncbi:hypothetical protein CERSUDRAFT_75400 [Gelatoporia subvermispora B]|uniref:Uncharacterized protein n=1 Tax=Ceriporiopsis subvermispora (strain B) TaxID=914234 RepID=M2R9I2_CERS8|nr:hypothetical protein CERSUDRAFT_75400 [Gelatoporia subvermispora B]
MTTNTRPPRKRKATQKTAAAVEEAATQKKGCPSHAISPSDSLGLPVLSMSLIPVTLSEPQPLASDILATVPIVPYARAPSVTEVSDSGNTVIIFSNDKPAIEDAKAELGKTLIFFLVMTPLNLIVVHFQLDSLAVRPPPYMPSSNQMLALFMMTKGIVPMSRRAIARVTPQNNPKKIAELVFLPTVMGTTELQT